MIITIEIPALTDPNGASPFRERALFALRRIQEAGHEFRITGGELTDIQQQLLDQEQILTTSEQGSDLKILAGESGMLEVQRAEDSLFTAKNWTELADFLTTNARKARLKRTTNETDIELDINLDGTGVADIDTGLKFFDHMLDQIARHGLIDLKISCKGDLEVDEHHTIEDVAIALGETFLKALGDKKGLERYGFVLAMDEAQATVALDLSNRPYLVFDVPLSREYVGDFPAEMLEHFFYSLAMNLKATLHVSCSGNNDHHKIEACFKGLARSLKMAVERNGRIWNQIPSSKGTL